MNIITDIVLHVGEDGSSLEGLEAGLVEESTQEDLFAELGDVGEVEAKDGHRSGPLADGDLSAPLAPVRAES